jgi:Lrp/AsnC family transcriptional regulator, leucine-responsive regulatory protein
MGDEIVDQVDRSLLAELQADGRLSFNELSRRVHLSSPAVAERVRRLEETGTLTGYHAHVDVRQAGWPVLALVLMDCYGPRCVLQDEQLLAWPKILEVHRVTGEHCSLLKVVGTSIEDYEQTVDRLGSAGPLSSMMVLSSPVPWRAVEPPPAES